jgi:hypothetical protein
MTVRALPGDIGLGLPELERRLGAGLTQDRRKTASAGNLGSFHRFRVRIVFFPMGLSNRRNSEPSSRDRFGY